MKQIFLQIQDQLATISEIKYIDKDWGQLQYEQPPIQFPAVLIDIDNIDYTQMGRGAQRADALISITVAGINLRRSSSNVAESIRENAYATIELIETIHQNLQLFSGNGNFTPMMRTNLRKQFNNDNYEVYTMTYKTSFTVVKTESGKTNVNASPVVHKFVEED